MKVPDTISNRRLFRILSYREEGVPWHDCHGQFDACYCEFCEDIRPRLLNELAVHAHSEVMMHCYEKEVRDYGFEYRERFMNPTITVEPTVLYLANPDKKGNWLCSLPAKMSQSLARLKQLLSFRKRTG